MKRFFSVFSVFVVLLVPFLVMGQDEEPSSEAFIFVDEEPAPINLKEVRQSVTYPEKAVEDEIQGTVIVRILIDKKGKYRRHIVVKEENPLLSAAVEEVIGDLVFTPAKLKGEPVMYWLNIPFPFKLVNDQNEVLKKKIADMTDKLSGDAENYEFWHQRGIYRTQLGEYDDALSDFEESIRLNPKSNKKNKKKKKRNTYDYMFYAHYGKGSAHFAKEQYENAIADFSAALDYAQSMVEQDSAVEATVPTVRLERGYTYMQAGKFREAREDLSWALANAEDDEEKCSIISLILDLSLEENNYPELVKSYDGMIECEPDDALNYFSRGYYKEKSDDNEGAVRDLAVAAEKTDNINVRLAAVNLSAGVNIKMGKYEAALAQIDKALKINVLNPQSYFYLGQLAEKQENQEKACENYKKALTFGLEGDFKDQAIAEMKESCGGWEE